MSEDDFVRNNRGCNGGLDFDPNYLRSIYRAIKAHEIVMNDVVDGSAETNSETSEESEGSEVEGKFDSQATLINALWTVLWPALQHWLDQSIMSAMVNLLCSLGAEAESSQQASVIEVLVEQFGEDPAFCMSQAKLLGPWLSKASWQKLKGLLVEGADDLAAESKLWPLEATASLIACLERHPQAMLAVAIENRDRMADLWKPLHAAWPPSVQGTLLLGRLTERVEYPPLRTWIVERCQMHLAQGVAQREAETLLNLALSQMQSFLGGDPEVWPHLFTLLGMATRMPHSPAISPLVLGLLLTPLADESIRFPMDFMAEYVDMLVTFIGTFRTAEGGSGEDTELPLKALHLGLVRLEGHLRRLPEGNHLLPVHCAVAQLCYHPVKGVRLACLAILPRLMLSLPFNGLPRLIDEYDLVLLPLLNDLQQERLVSSLGLVAVEEAQLRIVSLLGRLLLQNLHLLPSDPECFRQSLWMPVQHSLCSLYRQSGEPIRESLPETLKNILLVMHTANLIDQVWDHCQELRDVMPELITEMEAVFTGQPGLSDKVDDTPVEDAAVENLEEALQEALEESTLEESTVEVALEEPAAEIEETAGDEVKSESEIL